MTLSQILGLTCRHPYLSMPIAGHRSCNACGQSFPFTSYTLSDEDKAGGVGHYQVRERSITRVGNSILRFRKRKEQR